MVMPVTKPLLGRGSTDWSVLPRPQMSCPDQCPESLGACGAGMGVGTGVETGVGAGVGGGSVAGWC